MFFLPLGFLFADTRVNKSCLFSPFSSQLSQYSFSFLFSEYNWNICTAAKCSRFCKNDHQDKLRGHSEPIKGQEFQIYSNFTPTKKTALKKFYIRKKYLLQHTMPKRMKGESQRRYELLKISLGPCHNTAFSNTMGPVGVLRARQWGF